MALLTLLVVFIFGFLVAGFGSGSTSGPTEITPARATHHAVAKCSARMKAAPTAGESRRNCGGPPANP